MAYIGVPPVTGDFVVLDAITTSATASYTLQRNSANFAPESANHMLVSLNGSIQKPNASFTISGSTITFSSALTSSDAIDFILVLGNVNAVGVATTVSDSAITKAKTDFVSSGSGYTGTGLDIKGNGSANGRLGLLCSAGTHGVALESPDHSSAQSYTIQLPSNSPTVDKFIKVTSLTGSGATAIAHTQFADAGGTNTPSFHAYKNSAQGMSSGTNTKVEFDTEIFDTDNAFATNTFTVPSGKAGKYYFRASVVLDNSTPSRYSLSLRVNNSEKNLLELGNTGSYSGITTSSIFDLSAGDTVDAYFYHNGGGTVNTYAGIARQFFQGFKLL